MGEMAAAKVCAANLLAISPRKSSVPLACRGQSYRRPLIRNDTSLIRGYQVANWAGSDQTSRHCSYLAANRTSLYVNPSRLRFMQTSARRVVRATVSWQPSSTA